jgi:hypothetical protein
MDPFPWILVMVLTAAVVAALALVFAWKYRTGRVRKGPDYKAFFMMGLVWTIFGAVFMVLDYSMSFFLPTGIIFLALGLANRDKWGKDVPVSPGYRKKLAIATVAGVAALAVGVAALVLIG